MKLTIRKNERVPDWYVIESVDPNERWTDAAVTGSASEMLAVAEAIDSRGQACFRHCAVFADIEPARFLSPSNDTGRWGEATREEALDLSRQIHELLGYKHAPKCAAPASSAPSGDFSIGSRVWPGTSKLIEEMGELQQVLGKLIAVAGATDHWSGDLRRMLVEELGDVSAAIRFFGTQNLTTEELTSVAVRSDNKLACFREWQLDPKPPPATAPSSTTPGSGRPSAVESTASTADEERARAEAFEKGNRAKLGRDQVQHDKRAIVSALAKELGEAYHRAYGMNTVTDGGALGRWAQANLVLDREEELRAKVQAFERAEEIGFNAQGLHDRIDALRDAIAKRPVVKPVEGSKLGELDVVHDDHSHRYVPSSEYERVCKEHAVTHRQRSNALSAGASNETLGLLRAAGWLVAVHNDYVQDGKVRTLWAFSKGNQFIKGEGDTDGEALNAARSAAWIR
jgi:hypothetical protein